MRALRGPSIVLLLFVLLGGGAAYWYFDAALKTSVALPGATEREVTIPKGATLVQVGRILEEEELIHSLLVFRLYVRLRAAEAGTPKAGRHNVSPSMTIPQLLTALGQNPIPDDVPLTMIEGWRLADADASLATGGWIEPGAYTQAAEDPKRFKVPFPLEASSLAGYLLPETYLVPKGKLEVDRLIQRQIDAFYERFHAPHAEEIEKSGRSLQKIVVMASMLEREEPDPAMRSTVAGVLYKRLDANSPLGVDATSRFLLADWNDRSTFLKALRNADDPYNTRLKTGLPPGPIGAPSVDSLVAALRPTPSAYWYYLHDSNKQIHLARTPEEHEANRKRYDVY